jgi:hypothetical protein
MCTVVCCHAKKMNDAEIHHALHVVYGQSVMSEGTVRQWCRMFKMGEHNEEWSG